MGTTISIWPVPAIANQAVGERSMGEEPPMSRSALLRPDMNDIPSRSIRPLISVMDDPSMTWEARLEQGRPEDNVGKTGFVLEYLSLKDM